jgi:hypothetical protein
MALVALLLLPPHTRLLHHSFLRLLQALLLLPHGCLALRVLLPPPAVIAMLCCIAMAQRSRTPSAKPVQEL